MKKKKKIEIWFSACVPKTIIRYSPWDTESHIFFVIEGHFLPLTPSPSPSNISQYQNFEKKKKPSGDVIILNLCNKKDIQMMYAYSDMECARHNFSSF